MSNLYTADSIQSLDPREFCRLRPGVYCGDTEYSTQLVQEIFANSLDEHCIGHGNKIKITINKNVCEVEDEGQGFLINQVRPEDGKTVFEASLSVMNTSGKYNNETGVYEGTSLGLNGLGIKLTNFLSHWLEATTHRDGKFEKIYFKEGLFEKRETGKWKDNSSGTIIKWLPSEEFFTNPAPNMNVIRTLFKNTACLCPGLHIILNDNDKTEEFYSKNGLSDLVDQVAKEKEILNRRFNLNIQKGKMKLDLILTYTGNYAPTVIPYVNTGLTDSGPHITQIKAAITKELNKYLRDKKILKDKEENFSGEDIQEGMCLIFNLVTPVVKYDAQIKSRVVGLECKELITAFTDSWAQWINSNEKDVKTIIDKAIVARLAREKARKAKEAVREGKEKKRRKVINPDKLKDAENLGLDSILLCVEGETK